MEAEARRKALEDMRKRTAMVPFFLVFGLSWLGFGSYAALSGWSRGDSNGLVSGGVIAFLGALLLLRAGMLRARLNRDVQKAMKEDPA